MKDVIIDAIDKYSSQGRYYRRINKNEGVRIKDNIFYYIYKNEYWNWSLDMFNIEELIDRVVIVKKNKEMYFAWRKDIAEYRDLTGAIYIDEYGKIDYKYKETGLYVVNLTPEEKIEKTMEDCMKNLDLDCESPKKHRSNNYQLLDLGIIIGGLLVFLGILIGRL